LIRKNNNLLYKSYFALHERQIVSNDTLMSRFDNDIVQERKIEEW